MSFLRFISSIHTGSLSMRGIRRLTEGGDSSDSEESTGGPPVYDDEDEFADHEGDGDDNK